MKKEKFLVVSIAILLVLNISLVAFIFFVGPKRGHENNRQWKHRGHGPKKYIIEKLGFNEEQINNYEEIIPEHRKCLDSLSTCLKKVKKEFYVSVTKNDYPEKEIILNRIALLHRQIDSLNFNHFTKIKAICNAEQKNKFVELSKELAELFGPVEKK